MKRILAILFVLLLAIPAAAATFGNGNGGPRTTDNDDSCDISVQPAATLLLPYFEVSTDFPITDTTIFTITNVTDADRIARVTLWTEYSFPVISFNIYLTGYDVQPINLFDVIVRGVIAPDEGTGNEVSPRGPLSDPDTLIEGQFCDRMPGQLDDAYVQRMQSAFTLGVIPPLGTFSPACAPVGNVHANAIGYATIDVVGNCLFSQPNEPAYFSQDIRYDNVFTGDYQQIDTTTQSAQINPLVHIRAIPEGRTPSTRNTAHFRVNFPDTFYGRYSAGTTSDARQPLPSTFHARWIEGGPLQYETFYKIWREGTTGVGAQCTEYANNAALPVREVVVFDEQENPFVSAGPLTLPETSLLAVDDGAMPPVTNGAQGGWTYFNLDTVGGDGDATQNWVIVSMQSPAGYAGDFDATALGNGCTPEKGVSEASQPGGTTIGPAPNNNP
jgi:hypothetical protein